MKITETHIRGVFVIDTEHRCDNRGMFARLFCAYELGSVVASRRIVQINQSLTKCAGTVRGLHYQLPPFAEMKLIRCMRGRIWDVAVDLRANSATFLQWYATELSPSNSRMLVVPEGCAHGFQSLEPDTELLYLHTERYSPQSEAGVRPTDSRIAVAWPQAVKNLSARDNGLPTIDNTFFGVKL